MGFNRFLFGLLACGLLEACTSKGIQFSPKLSCVTSAVTNAPGNIPTVSAACDEAATGSGYMPISGPADTITIDARKVVRTICPDFYGINDSPAYDTVWNDPGTTAALAPLQFSVAREWGGSGVDWINFTHFPLNMPSWAPGPDEVWSVVQNHAKKLLWQTNSTTIGGNDPGGVPVAAMITYFKSKNIPIQAIEIGNENDNNSAQDFLPMETYNQVFTTQCQAAKAVDPNTQCMGPVSTNAYFWWPTNGGTGSPNTLENFLKATGNINGNGTVDKISLHWYPGYKLNTMTSDFSSFWPLIQTAIKKYDTRNLPVYFTEVSASSAGQENTWMGTALEAADMIEGMALSGVGGYDYFTVHRLNAPNDFGFLSASGEGTQNTPSPTYYAHYLIRQMGDQLLNISQGQSRDQVSTYASQRPDGSHQVMVINKTASAQTIKIGFTGFNPTGKIARIFSFTPGTPGSSSSTSAILNGVTMPAPTLLPAPTNITFQGPLYSLNSDAYSIYLIDIAP